MNPMNMIDSSKSIPNKTINQSGNQIGNVFDQTKDQPKPWVIE